MKVIRFNGREVVVARPRPKRPKRATVLLVPCRGRLLINCANGPGCKGHRVKWILL